MPFLKIGFLQNKKGWLFFIVSAILAFFAQPEQGEQATVVGMFLLAIMLNVIHFLQKRHDFTSPDEQKLWLMQATGSIFLALFAAILVVLIL